MRDVSTGANHQSRTHAFLRPKDVRNSAWGPGRAGFSNEIDHHISGCNSLEKNMDDAVATQPELSGDFAIRGCVVAPDHRARFRKPPGLFHEVIFEAAAANRTRTYSGTSH